MVELLRSLYGLDVISCEASSAGAGSDTFFIRCSDGRYVVKFPSESKINHPEAEPSLCEFLLSKGIDACRFVRNLSGSYISADKEGRLFHVQQFIDGRMYDWNTAPGWLLDTSAETLGRIHTALRDYQGLPEGIGGDFFRHMTPENALRSYENTLRTAIKRGHIDIQEDVMYRMELMRRFPQYDFDPERLTCGPTHGDYFISQLLCGEGQINAVIDWTTACVHPLVWEIMRSYVYAAPECAEGRISISGCKGYFGAYMKHAPLNYYDLSMAAKLFYYQIAVCDYYGQYYASTAANREIYLRQAFFSTGLLRWFDEHIEELSNAMTERSN